MFLDYASLVDPANASGMQQNPMKNFVSMPHVMGHEVIAEVVAVGPEAEGLEPGDRVALNPWLTCVTRGVSPVCPACEAGDLSQCHSFGKGSFAPGIHICMCADVSGGFADLMPAHDSMLFKVPDNLTDEQVVLADPFRCPSTPSPVIRRSREAKCSSTEPARCLCAVAILRALHPTVDAIGRFFRCVAFAIAARYKHHRRRTDARHERSIVTRAAGDVGNAKTEFIGAVVQHGAQRRVARRGRSIR